MVYEISEKINGMIRSPNDGVHLETPQAQTDSPASTVLTTHGKVGAGWGLELSSAVQFGSIDD